MIESINTKSTKYLFIDYLRAIAALLILNSHFDTLYPIPALATGGAIGNSIFFVVSGFCLYPIKEEFSEWIKKWLMRVYIPTLVILLLSKMLSNDALESANALDFFLHYIWPTNYWFVGAIACFTLYIIFLTL